MNQFQPFRFFRLSPDRIECDKNGVRVGDVALLTFNAKGGWSLRDEGELANDLSRVYGFPVDVGCKRAGIAVVSDALQSGNIATTQVATLLLQFPDPIVGLRTANEDREGLARGLVASGLLKAEDGWDESTRESARLLTPAGSPPSPKTPALTLLPGSIPDGRQKPSAKKSGTGSRTLPGV